MSTYTYDPIIGMTSECDINNRISYYEYDALSRLMLIRDQDKNVIKTIEYKYVSVIF
jgi:YD repeat-containing protein